MAEVLAQLQMMLDHAPEGGRPNAAGRTRMPPARDRVIAREA